jgi:hypothetical protein
MSDHGDDGEFKVKVILFTSTSGGGMSIYIVAFIVLMLVWISAWIGFHVTGGLIHILLVFAVVSLVLHFIRGRHGEADLRISK